MPVRAHTLESAMNEIARATTFPEPRKLGLGCKAIIAALVVVTVGLGVWAVVAVRAKMINDEKRERTRKLLSELADLVRCFPPPRFELIPELWHGRMWHGLEWQVRRGSRRKIGR